MTETTETHALEPGAYPALRLSSGQQVWLDQEEFFVQSKQGAKWLLVRAEDNELKVLENTELLRIYGDGALKFRSRRSRTAPLSPISDTVTDPAAKEVAARKHTYVQAALNHPEGFRRSKPWLKKIIQSTAARLEDENPPSPGSVLNWVERHRAYFNELGLAAYAPRHDLKGSRESRLLAPQQEAVEVGVNRYLQGGTAEDAFCEVQKYIDDFNCSRYGRTFCSSLEPQHLDSKGRLVCPSISTFRRALRQVSPFVRDTARVGRHYAKKRHRTYQTRARPQRPYEEVEVDFTPADIVLIADNGTHLGRPNVIMFRDRATAMIVGVTVTFDEPSYASVMEGLKHTIYRKSISHIEGLSDEDWPCMGRIERLFIDNGREFANGQLVAAATELGFEIQRLQPREPWTKGGNERVFADYARFVHQFAGTTMSNAVVRRDFEDLDPPVLTLKEFTDLTIKWIVTVFNRSPNRTLGDTPGVGKAPIDAWRDKVDMLDFPALPHRELFLALAGQVTERTVQKYGVEWDHITYWSPELDRILAHPGHRSISRGKASAKYTVRRDPYDLSKVYLSNHHQNEVIEVPVCQRWQDYTKELTVFQHRACLEHARVRESQRAQPDALWRARQELTEIARGAVDTTKRKKIDRQLKRFLYGKQHREIQMRETIRNIPVASEPIPLSPIVEEPTFVRAPASTGGDKIRPNDQSELWRDATLLQDEQPDRPEEDVDDLSEILREAARTESGRLDDA